VGYVGFSDDDPSRGKVTSGVVCGQMSTNDPRGRMCAKRPQRSFAAEVECTNDPRGRLRELWIKHF